MTLFSCFFFLSLVDFNYTVLVLLGVTPAKILREFDPHSKFPDIQVGGVVGALQTFDAASSTALAPVTKEKRK